MYPEELFGTIFNDLTNIGEVVAPTRRTSTPP